MAPQTDGLAVASIVCGVLGVCTILAIAAIVLGIVARRRIDASNGALIGRGWATAGVILGAVWVVASLGLAIGRGLSHGTS